MIDTCGYVPRIVRLSAQALAGHIDRYVFISTVSVYAEDNPRGMDEDSPLATLKDESVEEVTGETYGGLKVLCEKAVEEVYADRALIIRPGLIVGPHDPTDRFTYWPWRIAQGGEVLAPGNPDQPQQIIDARDLAQWIVQMVEAQTHGRLQRRGAGLRPDDAAHVGSVRGRVPSAGAVDVGRRILLAGAQSGAVERDAGVAAGKRVRPGYVQQCARHRRRAEVPPDRRDDPRHAGLGQNAPG